MNYIDVAVSVTTIAEAILSLLLGKNKKDRAKVVINKMCLRRLVI